MFLLQEFIRHLKTNVHQTLLVIAIIAITVSVPMLSITAMLSIQQWIGTQVSQMEITVFLDSTTQEEQDDVLENVKRLVAPNEYIDADSVRVITRNDAVEGLAKKYGTRNVRDVIELLGYNPLHDIIILTPNPQADLESLQLLYGPLLDLEWVFDVDINEPWVAHLQQLLQTGERLTLFVSIFFLASVWLLLSYSLNQNITKRALEIRIKTLLGASVLKVYMPFLVWNAMLGLIGSGLGVLLCSAVVSGVNQILVESIGSELYLHHSLPLIMYCLYMSTGCGFGSAVLCVRKVRKEMR